MNQESKEGGRVRKPSSKYDGEIVADDGAVQAIRQFQGEFKKRKKLQSENHAATATLQVSARGAPATKRQKAKAINDANKKVKSVPAPPLTSKEKALNDAEERLINAALERKAKATQAERVLPEGAVEVADLNAAVKRAVKECSTLLLDWTTREAQMVGSLCKVYWDGEHQWYYARILNYDSKYDRHYIYYYEDSTAEWISLENESVLVGDRVVLAKATAGSSGWPSLHYWASALAAPRQKFFKGYVRGADYCEYYCETGLMDWGFMVPDRILPIQDEYFPKKMNKKYEAALKKAQEENETQDTVTETVKKAVRDGVYSILTGEQWIGLRVRASTHSVFADADSGGNSSAAGDVRYGNRRQSNNPAVPHHPAQEAMCTGTVVQYCGVTNQHFIVFDDEGLQPQWVTAQKGVMDVLIGPGEWLPPSAASELALRSPKGRTDCHLCGLSLLNEDGSPPLAADVRHCDCCSLVCHTYCVPSFSLNQENPTGWTCWNCNSCFGCGVNSMKTELMNWNGKRTEPELGDDRNLLLCGDCLLRYKHVRDFCSICLKLYATDETMLPFQPAPVPPATTAAAAAAAAAADGLSQQAVESEVLCVEIADETSAKKPHWRKGLKKGMTRAQAAVGASGAETSTADGGANSSDVVTGEGSGDVMEVETTAEMSTSEVDIKVEVKSEEVTIEVDQPLDSSVTVDVVVSVPSGESGTVVSPIPVTDSVVTSTSAAVATSSAEEIAPPPAVVEEENMVQCNECARWVHAECEGIDQTQYDAMTLGTHPVWGDEYLCPLCRIKLGHLIINTLQKEDTISMFANPVTTAEAKNYFDVIGNPMDLSKMKSKCSKGQYKSLQTLRQDFELMCLNAIVFNQAGDEYWQHARAFHEKVQHQFNTQARLSHISANGFELNQLIEQYNAKVAAEPKITSDVGKGKRRAKGGAVNGDSTEGASEKRVKLEGAVSDAAAGRADGGGSEGGNDNGLSGAHGELSESARLALLSSSMLPSALAAVTTNEEMDAIDKENEANKLMSALDIILPTSRAPCPDPLSFMACAVMVQSSEEAFYTCCMDTCLLCGSAGSSAMFLYCVDCGEAVHSFCADAPLATMSQAVRRTWRCMNCKICETCGSATEAEESSLIYCERCDRAYHIGCLNPCMPAVPQSRWFCNECVDCKTCRDRKQTVEGSASDASAIAPTSSWGFEFDKCQFCTNEEERENRRIQQAQNEAHAARVAELMKKQRQMILNVYLCSICETDCSDNFLVCRNCGQNSHPQCNPSSCTNWCKDRGHMDFMCEPCLERWTDQPSHLGQGEKASRLLTAVASIQRARWLQQSRAMQRRKSDALANISEHLSANRHLLLAVLQWAIMRITRLEKDNVSLDLAVSRARDQPDLNLHYWVRTRASRFYCMWRRMGNKSRAEWSTFRSNLIKGFDIRGVPLDACTLSRYASMASAFITATGSELNPNRSDLELGPIVNEMIAKFPTRKVSPELENNALYAYYLEIMTRPYANETVKTEPKEGALPVKTESVANGSSSSNGGSSSSALNGGDEDNGESRAMDLIRLVKTVQSQLMCGPIGMAGSPPESFNHTVPLNVLRTNLIAEGSEEVTCNLVGEDYWNLKFNNTNGGANNSSNHSSGGDIEASAAVTSDKMEVTEDSKPALAVEASNDGQTGPVYNPSLGFPATILDNLKVSNALPGNLVRQNLLFHGRLTNNGLFAPISPSAVNPAGTASSDNSSSSSSAAFYGRVVVPPAASTGATAVSNAAGGGHTSKRKGLRNATPAAQEEIITTAVVDLTSAMDGASSTNGGAATSGVTAKSTKVNFAVAMGKHLDSVVSVSLHAGDNHFAKKARLQRLGEERQSTGGDNEQVQYFSAQDVEIHTAAEAAREKRAKQYLDAQSQKDAEERRQKEEEDARRRQHIVNAALKAAALHQGTAAANPVVADSGSGATVATADLQSTQSDKSAVANVAGSTSSAASEEVVQFSAELSEPPAAVVDDVLEKETLEAEKATTMEVEDESKANVSTVLPVPSAGDSNTASGADPEPNDTNGQTTHSSVDESNTREAVVDAPEAKDEAEETGTVGSCGGVAAMDYDAMSVTAGSIMETKSGKDVSVTTGSVVSSSANGSSAKRRSSAGSDAAGGSSSSSTAAAAAVGGGGAVATNASASKRPRLSSALWKNYITERDAVKVTEDLPDVVSECGLLVPSDSFSYPYCMEVSKVRVDPSNRCTETLPLRGWAEIASPQQPWVDPRSCFFCHVSTEDHFYGRLLTFSNGIYAHANCLRWSSDVTERGGVLYDCDKARERSVVATCHYCHQKGATVSCMNRRKCGRIYHLKCAAVVNCVFLECKGTKEVSEQTDFDVHTVILCAEHAGFVVEKSDRPFRKWLPLDPNRRLLLEDNLDTTVPEVSEMMSMKRGNKVVRSGALSILSIGDPRIDLPDFHTTQYLYPYHFKSARIFWSMYTPLQRTMYVFEIFSESDFEALPRSQSEYVQSSLDYYREQGGDQYDHGSTNSPLFRIISLDNTQRPMYIKSIQQAYDLIQAGVEECNQTLRSDQAFRRRLCLDSYGLNAHQFFGLGQAFVRRAIELIPESTAAMVALPPHPQYAPSFKLPTESDGRRIHRLQLAAKMTGAMSVNGCVRADGYVAGATRPMGVRITKMLTKVATDDSTESDAAGGKTGARSKQLDPDEEAPTFAVDEEREENRREIEYNRQRYLEMSAAYLKDPNAKLEVQKSRIHGWGLFARINFERNDIIVEYIGEKVRAVIADRREAMYEDEGVGSCYLFRLDKDDIVDATKTGGMARFMNHCCEPNAYARIISSNDPAPGVPENKHIVIIAARDIQEGEEITYDYKFPIEEKKLKCYCGALKCQGSMN